MKWTGLPLVCDTLRYDAVNNSRARIRFLPARVSDAPFAAAAVVSAEHDKHLRVG